MKYYTLSGNVGRSSFKVSKVFRTRDAAINYALKMMPLMSEHVEEEIVKSPASIEYVCTNMCRFTVNKNNA